MERTAAGVCDAMILRIGFSAPYALSATRAAISVGMRASATTIT
jgi:hypothetical protein